MNKKIYAILIVGVFLLTIGINFSAVGMEANMQKKNIEANSTGGQIASATIYISRFEEQVKESYGDIVVSGLLSGIYWAHLDVIYNKVWAPYRIEGEWHCKIGCNKLGSSTKYVFFDITTPLDYGMSENPPPNIHDDSEPKNLEPGLYEVYWSIDIIIWVYKNNIFEDKIEEHFHGSKGKSYIINNYNTLNNYNLLLNQNIHSSCSSTQQILNTLN